ncbi:MULTISPECIES: DUF1800 domain-containing protein [Ramlibacter]|uniref:DUF1800 domain-containing protein n=1 Tax=Ramlibacter aquaticus TaxID=2780094 RepID=A0ABR9SD87_9BURK|nr:MULTISPECIES: DUF1800 domain-containing protein [Ramlibacter]MBE7940314.1 DUF1800 domain-containing protein [Ramlibacter aquaticus]
MKRRDWLLATLAAGLGGCAAPGAVPRSEAGPPRTEAAVRPAPPLMDDALLAGRLDRLSWGVNDALVAHARSQGFAAFLAGQLADRPPSPMPDAVAQRIARMQISTQPLPELIAQLESMRKNADAMAAEDEKVSARKAYQQALNRLARESASRHVLRALYSPDVVRERMAWFWLNHFSVSQGKHNLRAMVADYEDTLRPRALGRFRALLGAATQHPAMLRYLDNERNAAGHINENHARELMELHTLGVDAGYTQHDVQEMARVMTGVGVAGDRPPPMMRPELQRLYVRRGLFEFNPRRHDFGPKELLGRPITSRGLPELEEALDRLAQHPATAGFICRKLAVYWMADEPDPAVVAAMQQAFWRTDGHIGQVLAAMFAQPQFWRARKFKDPMHYLVSAVRAAYDDRPILNTGPVLNGLARLAEPLYGRQTPDGYSLAGTSWSSSGQMGARFEVARSLGSGNAGLFRPDPEEEEAAHEQPAFPQLATSVFHAWRAGTLSPATRAALAQAASPQEWNTLLLASPEFMEC